MDANNKQIYIDCLTPPNEVIPLLEALMAVLDRILVKKDLDRDEPVKLLLEIKPTNPDLLEKTVLEALWVASVEWKAQKVENETKEIFMRVIKSWMDQGVISQNGVYAMLDEDTLVEWGVFNKTSYIKNKRRIKTKMVYELKKFNLFREENEGYSRLIIELTRARINEDNVDAVIDNVNSFIGFFKIDPNRVIDIIIDWYSNQPENSSFSKILNQFVQKWV
jgi:hypothetical protein